MTSRVPRAAAWLLAGLSIASCEKAAKPVLSPLPPIASLPGQPAAVAPPRVNGNVGAPEALGPAQLAYGRESGVTPPAAAEAAAGPRDISLDFAETDVREVAAQVLGGILKVSYAIDPAVHGKVTLRTAQPIARAQVLPTLSAMLSQAGAALVHSEGVYRIVPAAAGAMANPASAGTAGSTVLPLRYAGAEDLAKLLQPFAGSGKIAADAGRNALVVSGDPTVREALLALARSFDIDILANQSYALLPVGAGDAKDFATALQAAFRGQGGGALAGLVRVVPLERMNAVLLISSQRHYVDEARRVYALLQRSQRQTVRSWHVYYLQNSHANEITYVLQQAFTPNNITVAPPTTGPSTPSLAARRANSSGGLGSGMPGANRGVTSTPLGAAAGTSDGLSPAASAAGPNSGEGGLARGAASLAAPQTPLAALNPLLGGLDQSGSGEPATMRIISDPQNNAVLIYATPQEQDTIEAMLRKIDLLPLQVRIDATIAEVTLNDALRYGTQFFFRSGGINGILSNLGQDLSNLHLSAAAFNTTLPGFIVGGNGLSGAPLAISLLQQVTTVQVLSSPELLVLDNQPARLEVGSLVPYLSQTAQGTIVPNAPLINSIDYHQTGVILDVIPRVNSGGLVTLDISQVVSDVDTNPPTAPGVSINSPTFLDRTVQSRVVVQDGQTVGLAGLIRDNMSRGNSGIPWLKDVPLLGALAGSQANQRTRTELLVLITPHVVHDQRDARALTEDMREQLLNAAAVPQELQSLPATGSPDPNARLRQRIYRKLDP